MIRLVLFDIDGTLIHTGGAGVKAFSRAFEMEFKIPDGTSRLSFAGRTDTGLVRELFLQHGIPPTVENVQTFFDTYVFWLDFILFESQGAALPGVWEFLRDLRSLSLPPLIGLVTGNIRLGGEIKLRHFELWELFQTGAFADDHEDRDQIAAIARQRGSQLLDTDLRGDEILVIGDTPLDVRAARSIGARTLCVSTGGATVEELKACSPDWLVDNLTQVSAKAVCLSR